MLQKIIILDAGSRNAQLIARRLRELNVYCEIFPCDKFPENDEDVIGVVISESLSSTNIPEAVNLDLTAISRKYPVYRTSDNSEAEDIEKFLQICGAKRDWTPASFICSTVEKLKTELGDDKVILALSGGVDSSVCAVLLNRAIGKNLTCIFVDHGLLRKNEFNDVLENYKTLNGWDRELSIPM